MTSSIAWFRRRENKRLVVLVALATSVRLVLLLALIGQPEHFETYDSAQYIALAKDLTSDY